MSLSEPAEVLFRSTLADTAIGELVRPETGVRAAPPLALSVTTDIGALADDWRDFERVADCTVFQTYAWQSTWLRTVGAHQRVTPAIVTARDCSGALLFIMPLAVERMWFGRRLVWLAADFCDYNGPLLAPDFTARIGAELFPALWRRITALLRARPETRFDVAVLDKVPETIGGQPNPFLALGGRLNPNGAHLMALGDDWESFYRAKRSSATRRHDRAKRKKLASFGEIRFSTPDDPRPTLETLFVQKADSLARMGVANFFARPGVADFFRQLVSDPAARGITHVSRLDVGDVPAATNLGFVFRDRYYHVLTAYEGGEMARFAPGTAHLHELIGYAIGRGCRTFDFTVGDQDFKRNWCEVETRLYDFRIAGGPLGWPLVAASSLYGAAKRMVKRTPTLWHAFSAARTVAARMVGIRPGPCAKAGDGETADCKSARAAESE